jgi:hypothetical protein
VERDRDENNENIKDICGIKLVVQILARIVKDFENLILDVMEKMKFFAKNDSCATPVLTGLPFLSPDGERGVNGALNDLRSYNISIEMFFKTFNSLILIMENNFFEPLDFSSIVPVFIQAVPKIIETFVPDIILCEKTDLETMNMLENKYKSEKKIFITESLSKRTLYYPVSMLCNIIDSFIILGVPDTHRPSISTGGSLLSPSASRSRSVSPSVYSSQSPSSPLPSSPLPSSSSSLPIDDMNFFIENPTPFILACIREQVDFPCESYILLLKLIWGLKGVNFEERDKFTDEMELDVTKRWVLVYVS